MKIYKTTNLINGKIYVGQTRREFRNYLGSGTLLKRAIEKYGKENFESVILSSCSTQIELNKMERYWISELNSTNLAIGYNLETGGNSHSNHSHGLKGKTRPAFSKEWKNKLSQSHIGKKASDETKRKMSESQKVSYANGTRKKRIPNDQSGSKNPNAKEIIIDGIKFATIQEAIDHLGITRSKLKWKIHKG